jgi:hypothetical protein
LETRIIILDVAETSFIFPKSLSHIPFASPGFREICQGRLLGPEITIFIDASGRIYGFPRQPISVPGGVNPS